MTNDALTRIGRLLFGISLVAFGLLHFLYGDFVTRVVPSWPPWLPPRMLWVVFTGVGLLAAGVSVLSGIKPRLAMFALAGVLIVSIATLHLPAIIRDVFLGGAWTSTGKAFVLCGGCLAVAATASPGPGGRPVVCHENSRWLVVAGRVALALFLILGGAQHLRWSTFVATLVPTWVPGGAILWTYVTAVLLVAGGLGMLVPLIARRAALASGAMIFLWVFMVHLPRVVDGAGSPPNEITALFEALGFSGLAFLYAGTRLREDD